MANRLLFVFLLLGIYNSTAAQQKDNWIANTRPVSPRYRSGGKGLTPAQAFGVGVVVGGAVGYGIGRRYY